MTPAPIDLTVKVVDGRDRTVVTFTRVERRSQADLVARACLNTVQTQWTHLEDRHEFGAYVWDNTGRLLATV